MFLSMGCISLVIIFVLGVCPVNEVFLIKIIRIFFRPKSALMTIDSEVAESKLMTISHN